MTRIFLLCPIFLILLIFALFVSVPLTFAQDSPTSQNVDLVAHLPGSVTALAIRGDYAYLGTDAYLEVANISDPSAPSSVGIAPVRNPPLFYEMAIDGDYLYAATGFIQVFDISDATAPTQVTRYSSGYVTDIATDEENIYIAAEDGGFRILRKSDWRIIGQLSAATIGSVYGLDLLGNHAYVYAGGYLYWVSLETPDTPTIEWQVEVYGTIRAVADGYVYSTWQWGDRDGQYQGMNIYDLSDPTTTDEVVSYDTPGIVSDLVVRGDYAYLAVGGSLRILDISNPAHPHEVGFYTTSSQITDIVVEREYIYLTTDSDTTAAGGFFVLRFNALTPSAISTQNLAVHAPASTIALTTFLLTFFTFIGIGVMKHRHPPFQIPDQR